MTELAADRMALVDPDLRAALAVLPNLADLSADTLPQVRIALAGAPLAPAPDGVSISTVTIPGPLGQPDVAALLYCPSGDSLRAAILNIHGGGFVAGSAEREDPDMRVLSLELDVIILSVDYRLAPEVAFPQPLEDCFSALQWLHAQSAVLGIDPTRIAVRGVSAGGGLAAGLSLLARDRGGPAIAFQLLIYPMLDDRTSAQVSARHFVWPIEANRFGWSCYLGAAAGCDTSIYAAPGRAEMLAGLPRTFVATGAIDLFADEDIAYARRLIAAGVETDLHVYAGAYHGFNLVAGAAVAQRFERDAKDALRRALA